MIRTQKGGLLIVSLRITGLEGSLQLTSHLRNPPTLEAIGGVDLVQEEPPARGLAANQRCPIAQTPFRDVQHPHVENRSEERRKALDTSPLGDGRALGVRHDDSTGDRG